MDCDCECDCDIYDQRIKKNDKNILRLWYECPFYFFENPCDFTYLFFNNCCSLHSVIIDDCHCNMCNIVELRQDDFENGSYIIKTPGYYKLCENIIFSPNKDTNGKPTKMWLNQLDEKYRQGFVLGFFAMIVIQSNNVVLDLNGFKIQQSDLFFHQQTFYSHIELGSSPFIMEQGPAFFGKNIDNCNNVVIKNGHLGKTSHHGIHSPGYCNNLIFENLTIEEFAVGAIHLNGSHNVYINDVHIDNQKMKIEFNSLFSQAQFIIPFLERIDENETIILEGIELTIKTIKQIIQNDIDQVYLYVDDPVNHPYPKTGVFYNEGGLDANMYGIVLNSKGVAVNGFKDLKQEFNVGNNNIVLHNVSIKNISSKGSEIKVLTNNDHEDNTYGKGGMVGPVGDVFDFEKCTNKNGYYSGNCLSNAQLAVAKFLPNTRVNIPVPILEWASNMNNIKLEDVIKNNNYYILHGRDSMSHIMKGNIGIFCSQTYRLVINNTNIDNITNLSNSTHKDVSLSTGILFSGCIDAIIQNFNICNIFSNNGEKSNITYKNENKHIVTIVD